MRFKDFFSNSVVVSDLDIRDVELLEYYNKIKEFEGIYIDYETTRKNSSIFRNTKGSIKITNKTELLSFYSILLLLIKQEMNKKDKKIMRDAMDILDILERKEVHQYILQEYILDVYIRAILSNSYRVNKIEGTTFYEVEEYVTPNKFVLMIDENLGVVANNSIILKDMFLNTKSKLQISSNGIDYLQVRSHQVSTNVLKYLQTELIMEFTFEEKDEFTSNGFFYTECLWNCFDKDMLSHYKNKYDFQHPTYPNLFDTVGTKTIKNNFKDLILNIDKLYLYTSNNSNELMLLKIGEQILQNVDGLDILFHLLNSNKLRWGAIFYKVGLIERLSNYIYQFYKVQDMLIETRGKIGHIFHRFYLNYFSEYTIARTLEEAENEKYTLTEVGTKTLDECIVNGYYGLDFLLELDNGRKFREMYTPLQKNTWLLRAYKDKKTHRDSIFGEKFNSSILEDLIYAGNLLLVELEKITLEKDIQKLKEMQIFVNEFNNSREYMVKTDLITNPMRVYGNGIVEVVNT